MSVVMIGVGIDYVVFLISCYYDYVCYGEKLDMVVKKVLMFIGKVIIVLVVIVVVIFLVMVFIKLEVFLVVGLVIVVVIMVLLLGVVILLFVILIFIGWWGWIKLWCDLISWMWWCLGVCIVCWFIIYLVGSFIVLVVLVGCMLLIWFNYDDFKMVL